MAARSHPGRSLAAHVDPDRHDPPDQEDYHMLEQALEHLVGHRRHVRDLGRQRRPEDGAGTALSALHVFSLVIGKS